MLTLCFFKVILNKFFLQKTVVYSKFISYSGCKFLGFFLPKYFHVLRLSTALSATCSRKKSGKGFLSTHEWPKFDEEKTKDNEIEIAVQICGKLKGTITITPDTTKEEALALALADEKIKSLLDGKTVVKEIYIPGKIVNIVVK